MRKPSTILKCNANEVGGTASRWAGYPKLTFRVWCGSGAYRAIKHLEVELSQDNVLVLRGLLTGIIDVGSQRKDVPTRPQEE